MSTEEKAISEAINLIKKAKTHEELNKIGYKYWATKNAPIKGIRNVMHMAYKVTERRKELAEMGSNKNT